MGKTNPLNDADLAEFVELQKRRSRTRPKVVERGCREHRPDGTFDLSVRNPDGGEELTHRSPEEIMDEIAALDAESAEVLAGIRGLL